MKISEVMTPNPACCSADDTAVCAAVIMRELSVGIVPVVESEDSRKLVGVVTDRDLAISVVADGLQPQQVPLHEVMSADPVTCGPNDDVEAVLAVMRDRQVRRVPVVAANGNIVGVVSTADLLLCGQVDSEELDETMRDIAEPTLEEFRHLSELVVRETREKTDIPDLGGFEFESPSGGEQHPS